MTIFRSIALAVAALCFASAAQAAPWWGMASGYMIAPAGWRVVQQYPCPMDNGAGQSSYIWFPVSVCSLGSIDFADQSTWGGPASYALQAWVNRYCCGHSPKPNPINCGAIQLAELKWEEAQFQAPDYAKLEVTWDLKNRLGDAQRVRPYVLSKGYADVMFWGDGVLWGAASCTNVPNRELGILTGEPGC